MQLGGTVTGTRGRLRVSAVRINPAAAWGEAGRGRWIACDGLLMSGGWSAVRMLDASTLGEIEVLGPDAATFMNPMYTNAGAKLGVGRCRYGLLLGEDGFIHDDGVVGRLAEDRFHVATMTGGAARVLNMMGTTSRPSGRASRRG